MNKFELVLWFSKSSYAITTIEAKDYITAESIAMRKYKGKTILRIETYKKGVRYEY